jgi:HD-GYP domain-containing protein (c-di-GMP phosphodiesterase class II)
MNNFLDKLKLKYKVNIVFLLAVILGVTLILTFNITSNMISKRLEKNYNDYSQVNLYTNEINENLKLLDYMTIANALNNDKEYDLRGEETFKSVMDNLNLLGEHEFFTDSPNSIKLIKKIKNRLVGYKDITDSLKDEVDESYEDGMYAVLALSTTSHIIFKELTTLNNEIYEISVYKTKEVNYISQNIRFGVGIFILIIFTIMIIVNNIVVKSILDKLEELKMGISSFFDFLSKKRKDVIHLSYTDKSDDEISLIGKIIDEHMYIAEELLSREREETQIIEQRVKDATREITELNDELEDTQREIVFTMGAVAEERSKETGHHVKRVAKYSQILARLNGMSATESLLLKNASPMHDIGKIGIPDNILNKPGRFTPQEFEIMKEHAEIGYKMLKHSNKSILKAAAIVAYEHHEKWDGSGYPRGIKGEDIHIYGRITAIADVFDALGSDRVYKKAWSMEKIIKLFEEERGKHFDPQLTDLFLDNIDIFIMAKEKIDKVKEDMAFGKYIEDFEESDDIKAS